MLRYLLLAAEAAGQKDGRRYRLGAIGIRKDGVMVYARNGHPSDRTPSAHAEARLSRKLTPYSEVYVARVSPEGYLRMAMPCSLCRTSLRSAGVTKVTYSVDTDTYGVLYL